MSKHHSFACFHLDSLIPPNFGSTSKFIHYDWVKGNTLYEIDNLDNEPLEIKEIKLLQNQFYLIVDLLR